MIIRNKYHVPKKKWAKWSRRSRFVFNELFREMANVDVVAGPGMTSTKALWRVIRWNAAWLAGDLSQSMKMWEGPVVPSLRPVRKAR